MKVTIIGSGYVGLVTGACLAELGNDVFCLDVDQKKIDILNAGGVPIYEPGLEEIISRNRKARRLQFSTDVKASVDHGDIQFIAVGTPPDEDGSADLKYVLSAARNIGQHMKSSKVIIDKSTVPVGTAHKVKQAIAEELQKRGEYSVQFSVVSNPEFLKEGDAIIDSAKPFLIKAGGARVLLKEKTAIVVSMRDGVVKIRNLEENHAYSTHVFFGSRRFSLCAGQELVAASSFENLTTAVSEDAVKRRQLRTFDLADGTSIMCGEFSPVHVIKSVPTLKAMYQSSSKDERKSFNKIMKMSAALAIVMRSHGEFAPISSGREDKIASAQ
ncbi:MAG: hypothetical protein K2X81_12995 [Candidatus Obscuribacterales bacterium]|nr:hypothetical protein [Candidatus Obscuribacterales bacterium]